MMDVNLVNILLSPTTSRESSGQPRTELALLTSLFSLVLSRSVLSPADASIEHSRGYHRVIKCPGQRSAHYKGPQSAQKVETTLAFLVQGVGVV